MLLYISYKNNMSISFTEQKKKIRQEVKQCRRELPAEYCRQSDSAIFACVTGLKEYQQADVIFCFVGTEEEIDTLPIIHDAWKRGKRVGVPLCVAKGVMEVRQIFGEEDLINGFYGIQEPKEECLLIKPEAIQLAIVPCISCSRNGSRLGYGGGYYDRYLGRVETPKVVLCRERLMREDIPEELHDLRMDVMISESGIYRNRKGET